MMLLKSTSATPVCTRQIDGRAYYVFRGLRDNEIIMSNNVKYVDVESECAIHCDEKGVYFTQHSSKCSDEQALFNMRTLISETFHKCVAKFDYAGKFDQISSPNSSTGAQE